MQQDSYVFTSISKLIDRLEVSKLPEELRDNIKSLLEHTKIRMRFDILKRVPAKVNRLLVMIQTAIETNNLDPITHELILFEMEELVKDMKVVNLPEVDIDKIKATFVKQQASNIVKMPYPILNSKMGGLQQGLCIFIGASNIGKTGVINNLVAGWMMGNTGVLPNILYVSLDDPIDYTWKRIISILHKMDSDKIRDCDYVGNEQAEVDNAVNAFAELHNKRHIVWHNADTCGHIDQFELAVRQHCEISENPVVIIDGVFNMSVGNFRDMRQESIERFNRLKKVADKHNVPVIITAEVGKDKQQADLESPLGIDALMETGKGVYHAAYIFTVFPEKYDDFQRTDTDSYNLIVNLVKNKRGRHKGAVLYKYNRYNCSMTEVNSVFITRKKHTVKEKGEFAW